MRTTLKDVAKKLDLSPALVSGILNDRPNVWASEETRARVLDAARLLNYQPSAAARALSQGRTNTIAFVYRRLEGYDYRLAYSGLVDVLSAELQSRGLDLLVSNFAEQDEVLEHLARLAHSRACDAVILWGREADTEAQGALLESLNVPFLVKGRHEAAHPSWKQIDFDHEGMMKQAVDHVADLGHQRIAYLGFPHDEAFVHSLRRGFTSAYEARFGRPQYANYIAECEDMPTANEARINRWLTLPADERPTAFVLGAGNAAWHALETALAHIGERLGLEGGKYAAAGTTAFPFTLMFGDALVYQGIEIDSLAKVAFPHLFDGALQQDETPRIIRFRPPLTHAPTLDLLKHGVKFVNQAKGGAL